MKNGTNTCGNKESDYREPKRIGDVRLFHVAVRLLIWHSLPRVSVRSDSVYTHNDVLAADLADDYSASTTMTGPYKKRGNRHEQTRLRKALIRRDAVAGLWRAGYRFTQINEFHRSLC